MSKIFSLPAWADKDAYPLIQEENETAFYDFAGCDIYAPSEIGKAVVLPVVLHSCVLNVVFEGVENFISETKSGTNETFLSYELRRTGESTYEYTLHGSEGNSFILFRTARTEICDPVRAAVYIKNSLEIYRENVSALSDAEKKLLHVSPKTPQSEIFPAIGDYLDDYFTEKETLGTVSESDEPYLSALQFYRALTNEEIIEEPEGYRIAVGGYLQYLEEHGNKIYSFLLRYAPKLAGEFAQAASAHGKNDTRLVAKLTRKHLAPRYKEESGVAVLSEKDFQLIQKSAAKKRTAEKRHLALTQTISRAVCLCALNETKD